MTDYLLRSSLIALFTAVQWLGEPAAAQEWRVHAVALDDLLTINGGGFPQQLSPDGSMLAYNTLIDSPAAGVRGLWLIATTPGSTPRNLGKGVLPKWSPDGTRLAYYSDASIPHAYQLWILDVKTGHAEQITHVRGGIDPSEDAWSLGPYWDALAYDWSPDGTQLVFASQVVTASSGEGHSPSATPSVAAAGTATPLVLTATTPAKLTIRGLYTSAYPATTSQWAFWESPDSARFRRRATNQLFVVDIRSKIVKQLTVPPAEYHDPAWSPDGQYVACLSRDPSFAGYVPHVNVNLVDVRTGRMTGLVNHSSTKWELTWSPDAKYLAYQTAEHIGARQVYIVRATGGEPVDVTAKVDRSVFHPVWAPDSKALYVDVIDGVDRPIDRIDIATGHFQVVSGPGAASRGEVTVARDGTIAWTQDDPTSPYSIRLLRPGARTADVLFDFDPQVKAWALGEQEVLQWTNHRGDTVDGVLIKPVGYQAGHRYPLIVDVYPITANAFKGAPLGGNQAWANRGYAVFMPTSRAPHFWMGFIKSEAYTQAGKGPNGWDLNLDDVMSGVDEIIRLGIADSTRMCLYGFSNGGGVVDNLVTRTDRFKCAVSVAGAASDWLGAAVMQTDAQNWTEFEGGISVWDDPETYIQLSPVYRATKVKTPMLLAAGDRDGDFLLGTIVMFNGLRYAGDDVTLLRYPNQGHGFTGAALQDFWRRESAFFDKYLMPHPVGGSDERAVR